MNHDEPGFDSILASLIEEEERAAGQPIDIAAWTARYPEYAEQIRSFLAHREKLEGVWGPRGAAEHDLPTIALTSQADVGQRLRYFGDYELLEEIARGGMGVVYKARQVSLNRIVAIKMILSGHLAGPSDVQRFHAEAEAAASLDHPHIVPIYEVGEHEGQHYFSMKLIEGGNLYGAMQNRPSNETSKDKQKWAASIVIKVAHAVHHAHQRGILHRDLKPGNILIDAAGDPHVTDFGLARHVEGGSDLTHTGAIVGTPAYMAPEQARCEKGLSPAADVYSLGVILYELLTGQPPFRAASVMETIREVLDKEPVSPRLMNPKVPAELESICLKCIEKQPVKRYSTAKELAEDLTFFLGGEPVKAKPPSLSSLLNVWYGQQWKHSGLAFLMALLICIPGVLGLCFSMEFVVPRTLASKPQTIYPSLTFRALGFSYQMESNPDSGLIHLVIKLLTFFWLGAVGGICAAILKPVSRMETLTIGLACGCAMLITVLSVVTVPQFLHHISDRAGSMTRNVLQQGFKDIEPVKDGNAQFTAKALKSRPELLDKSYPEQLESYLERENKLVSGQVKHEARFFTVECFSVVLLCLGAGIASAYFPRYYHDFKAMKGSNTWLSATPFDYWMYLLFFGPIFLFVVTVDSAMQNQHASGYILPFYFCLFGMMLLGLVVVLEYTLRQMSSWQVRRLSPWPLAGAACFLLLVTIACEFFNWKLFFTIPVGAIFLGIVAVHYYAWRWHQDSRQAL